MSLLEGLLFKKVLAWFNDEKILHVLLWNETMPEVIDQLWIITVLRFNFYPDSNIKSLLTILSQS